MSRSAKLPTSIEDLAASWVFRRSAGLTQVEQAELDAWKASDPRHAAALAQYDRAWAKFERPRAAGQAKQVIEQLETRGRRRRRRKLAAGVAALSLVFAVVVAWQFGTSQPRDVAGIHSAVILPETRILPDGSRVELKSGAEIAVDYAGQFRRVTLLRGEGHFEVAKNKERPFIVTAGGVDFRAVGTAFSVQLGAKAVELLVTEGTVAVARTMSDQASAVSNQPDSPDLAAAPPPSGSSTFDARLSSPSAVLVTAGNHTVIPLEPTSAGAPSVQPMSEHDRAERLAWRAPRLEFTETPLAEAVALMNQHNRVQLVVDDSGLAQLRVSGLFRADRSEAFVRLLETNFGVKAETEGDTIHLRKAR